MRRGLPLPAGLDDLQRQWGARGLRHLHEAVHAPTDVVGGPGPAAPGVDE